MVVKASFLCSYLSKLWIKLLHINHDQVSLLFLFTLTSRLVKIPPHNDKISSSIPLRISFLLTELPYRKENLNVIYNSPVGRLVLNSLFGTLNGTKYFQRLHWYSIVVKVKLTVLRPYFHYQHLNFHWLYTWHWLINECILLQIFSTASRNTKYSTNKKCPQPPLEYQL